MSSSLPGPSWATAVDHFSPLPFYAQVKEALRMHIEQGDWKPGHQLPGELELCEMFGVSRTVVRQALTELVYDGLIVKHKGKGTFVAEPKITEALVQKLTGFYQDMSERGTPPVSRILKQERVPASSKIARLLRLEPGEPVIELERLRFVQDEPIALVTTFLPYERCPQVLEADLTRQSLYAVMAQACRVAIARGERIMEAVAANQREAQLLEIEQGSPLMLIDSVSFEADGTPVEYYHAVHRGDRSRFVAEVVAQTT
jgi:GntR family transcriptional regulator